MTIEEALVSFLTADAALLAAIPDGLATPGLKLMPEMMAQKTTTPYLTYAFLAQEDDQSLAASLDLPTGTLWLKAYGDEAGGYNSAKALMKLAKNSKGGQGGLRLKEYGPGTWGTVVVRSCRILDEYSEPEMPASGSEYPVRVYVTKYSVCYEEQ